VSGISSQVERGFHLAVRSRLEGDLSDWVGDRLMALHEKLTVDRAPILFAAK
jgi:hypothetical protein